MDSIGFEYEVHDEHGPYGKYDDKMKALMVVNRLYQEGKQPYMYEVHRDLYDWQTDLDQLFNGIA